MQADQIATFLDVFETRNFNRSAERLGVTQSTVSGRIAALERDLGVRLFRRSRAGCDLTTAGLRFEPHARALRHTMTEARAAARGAGGQAMELRLGLQADLAASDPGRWVERLRDLLPEAAIFLEADYSVQMCRDLLGGDLDLAVLFSPQPAPDLHFESLGEMTYRMIAPHGAGLEQIKDVTPARYVMANVAPAFSRSHAVLLPQLAHAGLTVGQSAMAEGVALALNLAAYVDTVRAARLVETGQALLVSEAPTLTQPVFAALHHRNRHRPVWRKLIELMRRNLETRP